MPAGCELSPPRKIPSQGGVRRGWITQPLGHVARRVLGPRGCLDLGIPRVGVGAGPEEWRWENWPNFGRTLKVKSQGSCVQGACVWGCLWTEEQGSGFLGGTHRVITGENTLVSEAGSGGSQSEREFSRVPEGRNSVLKRCRGPEVETLWVCAAWGGPLVVPGAGASCWGLPQAWREQVSTWKAGPRGSAGWGLGGCSGGGVGRPDPAQGSRKGRVKRPMGAPGGRGIPLSEARPPGPGLVTVVRPPRDHKIPRNKGLSFINSPPVLPPKVGSPLKSKGHQASGPGARSARSCQFSRTFLRM